MRRMQGILLRIIMLLLGAGASRKHALSSSTFDISCRL